MRKLVIATTIALTLGLAASASAAVPRKFFGTIGFTDPTTSEFNRLGRGKLGTYRTNLSWAHVQRLGPTGFNWSQYDRVITDAARNGIQVLPTIYGSPRWAARKVKYPPDAEHRDEFANFLKAAADRYGPGGSFWLFNPLLPEFAIRDWQLWNEPSSPSFWLPRPKPKAYKKLLVAANRGLHAGDPNARIMLAGLFTEPNIRHGVPMVRYLKGLYRAGGRKLFDLAAVHPYAITPRRVIDTIKLARRIMRRHGDGKKPIFVTEVGWASSGRPSPFTKKPRVQARYLRKTFRLTSRKRGKLKIGGVIWFSHKDQTPTLWIYRTGLFTVNGRAKPAWNSFVRFTGGRP